MSCPPPSAPRRSLSSPAVLSPQPGLQGPGPAPPAAPCTLQVEGRWLTVRLAASRAHLVSPDDPLRLGLHSLRTRDGDMEFVLFWT